MTSPRLRTVASLAALGLLLIVSTAALADSEGDVQTRWARLTRTADVIATGECVAEHSAWDESTGLIVTTIEFRPRRFYKGELTRALTVKTLGGRVGDESIAASHGASLAGGEQVLLFLKRSEFGSYFVVAGGDTGKVRIEGLPDDTGGPPTMADLTELTRLLNGSTATQ